MRTGNVLPERGNISDLDIFFLFSLPTVIMIDLFFRVKFRRITRLLWNGDLFQSAATSHAAVRTTYELLTLRPLYSSSMSPRLFCLAKAQKEEAGRASRAHLLIGQY